jgi:hypothetical protein
VIGLQKIHGLTLVGKVNWNTAPRGSFASAHSRPPWASMIDRQIDSPIPVPPVFVV